MKKNNQTLGAINFAEHALILFDGECLFCNKTMQFVLKNDQTEYFLFAALESDIGQEVKAKYFAQRPIPDSIILITEKGVSIKSNAILRIFRKCQYIWVLYYVLFPIPKPIQNTLYDWFAQKRYSIFGKTNTCMLPHKEVRHRFFF